MNDFHIAPAEGEEAEGSLMECGIDAETGEEVILINGNPDNRVAFQGNPRAFLDIIVWGVSHMSISSVLDHACGIDGNRIDIPLFDTRGPINDSCGLETITIQQWIQAWRAQHALR